MRGHITGPCALPTALQAHRPWPGLPQRFLVGGEALAPMQKTCGKRHVSCRIIIAYPRPNCNTRLWIFITLLTLGTGVVSITLGQLAAVGPKAVPLKLAAIIGMVQPASIVVDKIKAAQYVRNHPGEVCPAKWKEGAETLKPSLDLVGKI